eukprot:gene3245-4063_t
MRNISHIQLKDLEEVDVDQEEFEIEGDDELRTRKKKFSGDFLERYRESKAARFFMSLKYSLLSFFNTITATNTRKAILLALIGLFFITFTITISLTTKSKDPKNQLIYNDIRLPGWIKPIDYLIHIETDISNFVYNGTSISTLNITQEKDFIIIHSGPNLNYSSVYLEPLDKYSTDYPTTDKIDFSKSITPEKMTYDTENAYYVLQFSSLSKLVKKHQYFKLYITFNSTLTDNLNGFYRSQYKQNGVPKWLATTQFEPADARKAFPCFDEPALKANWTIWLSVRPEYNTTSNMQIISQEKQPNNLVLVKFEATPVMSSYLVCFIVHQFDMREDVVDSLNNKGVKLRVWANPELINTAQYALDISKAVIPFYSKYFNMEYPLKKLDLVAIPDFAAGAMENWGCMTFREKDLMFDPQHSDVTTKQRVAEVVAHEIAHQWFGDIVTMKWWTDLWLNEGFATYMSYKSMGETIEELDSVLDFDYLIKQSGMAADSKVTTHPISNNFTSIIDIQGSFDSITYDKGASVIRMLDSYLNQGQDYFKTGIQNYLDRYKYGNAETMDLWKALYEATDKKIDVPTIMNNWISKSGLPLLNVSLSGKGQISITQSRYFDSQGVNENEYDKDLWLVPINAVTKCPETTQILLSDKSKNTPIDEKCSGLFLVNPDSTGFYRTLYDKELFDLLIQDFKSEKPISKITGRVAIIDDYFSFVQAGIRSPSDIFEALQYLKEKKELIPIFWKTLSIGIDVLQRYMQEQDCFDFFKKHVTDLYTKGLLDNVDWKTPQTEYTKRALRKQSISLGSSYKVPQVIAYLNSVWQENKKTPEKIDPDIRLSTFTSIVSNGGEEEYDWVLARFNTTTSINERTDALVALTSSKLPHLVQRTLRMIINQQVKIQDYGDVFTNMAFNPFSLEKVWRFMKDNFDLLKQRCLPADLGVYVLRVSKYFTTEGQLKEFQDFFVNQSSSIPKKDYELSVETIKVKRKQN